MLAGADWVKTGYAKGVPMGGDLPPAKGKAPTFIVWAVKDPTSGNLDRIQIVKGWTKSGQSFEKIFDVVWSGDRKPDKWTGVVPPIGSTVDVENATYTNTIGAVELKTVWTDPEFDPSAARLLLRARARDPDAALDHDPGQAARHRAARRRGGYRAGARVGLAHLVHAEYCRAQEREGRHDRRRLEEAGRSGA